MEPKQKDDSGGLPSLSLGDEAKHDDTLLSLSLGNIYSNAAAVARARTGGFGSPVTPTMPPIPLWLPVGVQDAPPVASATAAQQLPHFDGLAVLAGSSNVVFPTAVPSQAAMAVVFPTAGDGAASLRGDVNGAPPTAEPAPTRLKRVAPLSTAASKEDFACSTIKLPRSAKSWRSAGCRSSTASGGGADGHTTNTSCRHDHSGDADVRGNEAPVEIEGGLHICPPYPWATDRVSMHYSLVELSRRGIQTITGELQCKRCDDLQVVSLDIQSKFKDICSYISCNIQGMNDRAPRRWKEPALPDCEKCGQKNSMRPVISADKHRINWIFLLLSEMLGLCTLEQLKYFCAHTRQHRTGAKDRVLYSTYMELCNQLLPNGLFDMTSERKKRTRPNA